MFQTVIINHVIPAVFQIFPPAHFLVTPAIYLHASEWQIIFHRKLMNTTARLYGLAQGCIAYRFLLIVEVHAPVTHNGQKSAAGSKFGQLMERSSYRNHAADTGGRV